MSVTIQALFTDTADSLALAWVDGECGAGRCFLENLRGTGRYGGLFEPDPP